MVKSAPLSREKNPVIALTEAENLSDARIYFCIISLADFLFSGSSESPDSVHERIAFSPSFKTALMIIDAMMTVQIRISMILKYPFNVRFLIKSETAQPEFLRNSGYAVLILL